jgi:hypothetical protein
MRVYLFTSTAGLIVEAKDERELREKIREAAEMLREASRY